METLKQYRIGDIADIIGGVTFSPDDICLTGVRILRGGNIQRESIELKSTDIFLPDTYKSKYNQIQVGDTIIVASTGSAQALGKAATCFIEMPNTQIGAFLRIVRPKEEKFAMLVSIALTSPRFAKYIKAQAKGTNINNINLDYIKKFTVPIVWGGELDHISTLYRNIQYKIELNKAINHNLPTPDHSSKEVEVRLVA